MVFIDTRETAAFNLAMPYLNRVNAILNSNYVEFKNSNIRGFSINLKQLYRELKPWLRKIPDKEIDEITPIDDLFEQLAKLPQPTTPQRKEKIWEKMEEIEDILRDHFKKLGMLMPKVTDSRFLFGSKQR